MHICYSVFPLLCKNDRHICVSKKMKRCVKYCPDSIAKCIWGFLMVYIYIFCKLKGFVTPDSLGIFGSFTSDGYQMKRFLFVWWQNLK